ncbi:hypothetical protein PTTG_25537 [Puccinia triticina 1-1 BBBD Race 1]|uniref:Uncharacterized protein n=1 Tax=Puccinia triticina (isolate 1-1 / race 1 (BBBD)) TaxID=630390 RepID=A0A180H2W3_PUCT1|nr:hypothetical protein PTTG_25537 [Puccinia triticina 1-1 BBBD Race 1]
MADFSPVSCYNERRWHASQRGTPEGEIGFLKWTPRGSEHWWVSHAAAVPSLLPSCHSFALILSAKKIEGRPPGTNHQSPTMADYSPLSRYSTTEQSTSHQHTQPENEAENSGREPLAMDPGLRRNHPRPTYHLQPLPQTLNTNNNANETTKNYYYNAHPDIHLLQLFHPQQTLPISYVHTPENARAV